VGELKSFDRVADVYDETRGLPAEVSREIGEGLAAILRRVSDAPRLLEVGVGTGRMAVPLSEAGVRVAGIDISSKMMALLREKRSDIDVMLAEATKPPLRPASFDGLLFVHILHLVPDVDATLRATIPLVRGGGVVIHGVDDHNRGPRQQADAIIQAAVKDLSGRAIADRNRHRDALGKLEQALGDAGARIERVTLATWRGAQTGRRMIERLARKDYSSSWLIPDEVLPRVIERVTPQLDELYGGLDRVVEGERAFSVLVGWLPG